MKFFIPAAESPEQAERVYQAVKDHLGKELGAEFSSIRISAISYVHNGKNYSAEIGKPENIEGEPVIAILFEPGRSLYHVCTANRGVLRGMSILVGSGELKSLTTFDPE